MTLATIYGLPSIHFEEMGRLPPVCAVYFALAASGEVLYIGRARNLVQRWNRHHRLWQLYTLHCTQIAWETVPRADLYDRERHWIQTIRPRLNDTAVPPWSADAADLHRRFYLTHLASKYLFFPGY